MGANRDRYRFSISKTVHVEIFCTKSNHFRARIDQENGAKYEVTLGGVMWDEGKGREYESEIKARCKNIIDDLIQGYKGAFGEDYQVQD